MNFPTLAIPQRARSLRNLRNLALGLAFALTGALALTMAPASAPAAWAEVAPGIYTATVTASYTNPDDGTIADAGGQSNATLGQSMVEGVTNPEALIENDGNRELITMRFGQAGLISDVRVAADVDHSGTFADETSCELAGESADGKTADYRFEAPDDAATLRFTMYVEPMGRDVTFFAVLGDAVAGNSAGFAQTIDQADIDAASSGKSGQGNVGSQQSDSATTETAAAEGSSSASAGSAAATATSTSTGANASDSADEPLNVPLIAGIVIAAIVVIALVAYFAAIRPGQTAAKEAEAEAARREKLKRS